MQETTTHTLLTKGLKIGYATKSKNLPIVSDINMQLQQGELIGLIGINGSGKSTLLRTLAGLQTPLAGKVELMGQTMSRIPASELAQQMSVVLTNQSLSKNLTVLELVSLGRQPYANWIGTLTASDATHIENALIATDCLSFKNKKCYELSDGQLQRVLVARALAQDPVIMLLDEPLSHLDLHHKAALLKLLKSIAQEQGKTVLFSTHDIEHSLSLCDRMVVLQNGNARIGTPQTLIQEGIFNTLFPSEHITFNASTGHFSIDK